MRKQTIMLTLLFASLILTSCASVNSNRVNPALFTQEFFEQDKAKVESEKIKSEESSLETKEMTMVFEKYSEGDYPHLLFKDISSGEQYDFRFLSDNNLNGINILLEDNQTAFGMRANPEYLNKTFKIIAKKKEVLDSDLEGKTIKAKEWVISSLVSK
jgi:hypothetical protein